MMGVRAGYISFTTRSRLLDGSVELQGTLDGRSNKFCSLLAVLIQGNATAWTNNSEATICPWQRFGDGNVQRALSYPLNDWVKM